MKPFAKLLRAAALAAGFAAPARADVIYSNPAQLPTTGWLGRKRRWRQVLWMPFVLPS